MGALSCILVYLFTLVRSGTDKTKQQSIGQRSDWVEPASLWWGWEQPCLLSHRAHTFTLLGDKLLDRSALACSE
jgi:hypothetical protein